MVSFHTRRRGQHLGESQIQRNLEKICKLEGREHNRVVLYGSPTHGRVILSPPPVNGTDIGIINVIFN
jgi:hypothetical protein